ncbi:MAG: Flp family type IVb pilin [Dongiaceae bacterium]
MLNRFKQFAMDDSGATAIEYALIAALVAIGIVSSVAAVGSSLQSIFSTVASAVDTATSS